MRPPRLNLYHLITFYFVASERSFSVAAEKLFLTEPAISLHIKSLERSAGTKLLDVRKKRVYLTKAGERVFQYAEEIYQQAKNTEKFLENLKEASLHIGVSMTFSGVVALATSKFEELFPRVKLSIRHGASYQIVEELLDLQHDIAVVVSSNYPTSNLRTLRVSNREELVLVTSPSDPICSREGLKLTELCSYPLLLPPEKSATRKILLERIEAEGSEMSPLILVETDYLECAKRLAEEGKGIALMHITNVEREVAQRRLKVLSLANDITIGVDVIVHRSFSLPLIGERFISLVEEAFQACHSHQAIAV